MSVFSNKILIIEGNINNNDVIIKNSDNIGQEDNVKNCGIMKEDNIKIENIYPNKNQDIKLEGENFKKRDGEIAITSLSYDNISTLIDESKTPKNSEEYNNKLKLVIESFRHWNILEQSFLRTNHVNEQNPSVDFEELDRTFGIICSRDSVCESTREILLESLQKKNYEVSSLLKLRTLLLLLENPLVLSEDIACYDLLKHILIMINNLNSEYQSVLVKWFSKYKNVKRLENLIHSLQQYLTIRITACENEIEELTNDWMHESKFDNIDNENIQEDILREIRRKQISCREQVINGDIEYVVKMLKIFHESNKMISNSETTHHDEDVEIKIDNNNNLELLNIASKCISNNVDVEEDKNYDGINIKSSKCTSQSSKTPNVSLKGMSPIVQPLPEELFHNSGLNDLICGNDNQRSYVHHHDYECWKSKDGNFSYLNYPFLLDARSKARYLEFDNLLKQAKAFKNLLFSRHGLGLLLLGSFNVRSMRQQMDLVISVRRTHIVEDTLVVLDNHCSDPESFRRRLRIEFVGEAGIDQGGLIKEYFQLIVKQLFDVNNGMFVLNEKTHNYWFNRNYFENDDYKLVGILLGMAIYNNTILDCRFPRAMFKKLLGQQIDFEDFRDFDPEMAKGFEQMMKFDTEIEDIFCRTFSIKYEYCGTEKEDELKTNGSKIFLKSENREEYIQLYIDYLLNTSIAKQFDSFYTGFKIVCDSSLFKTFSCEELELLVCGSKKFDFESLETSAKYDDGYVKNSQIVKQFWEIAHQLSEEDKRKLLAFCTGSDRVPIGGLREISLTISKNGSDDTKFPTSHTCFNHLLLPEYSSKQIMRERLLTAIQNSEGFGLL